LPALTLESDGQTGLKAIAFQIAPQEELSAISMALGDLGIRAQRQTDRALAVAEAISFDDPDGTRVELFSEFRFAKPSLTHGGIMPLKLGHVACKSRQAKELVQFYSATLGFRLSDWREGQVYFLRCNPDHHTLNFFQAEERVLEHVAFELRDGAEVTRACDVLAANRVRLNWGPSRHFIGHNFACYHYVQDGYRIELYAELDQIKDETLGFYEPRPWHQEQPQRPRAWGDEFSKNYWGSH
jgi:catechol 2,3-dioxygenase-like lactoylglutathione lyase family enzyme